MRLANWMPECPNTPPAEGGVSAPKAQTGWLFNFRLIGCLNNHPVRSLQRMLRAIFIYGRVHPSFGRRGVWSQWLSHTLGHNYF